MEHFIELKFPVFGKLIPSDHSSTLGNKPTLILVDLW